MSDRSPDTPLLIAATIDASDLESMTRFWGGLLDVEFQTVDQFGFLAHAPDRKVTLWLQRVPEEKAGKNRVHLDFVAGDMTGALAKVDALGGAVGDRHEWQGHVWTTCSDPEGNVFDVMQAQEQPAGD